VIPAYRHIDTGRVSSRATPAARLGSLIWLVALATTWLWCPACRAGEASSLSYSPTRSATEPYAACAPPTPAHAQCLAIVDPTVATASPLTRLAPSGSADVEASPACDIGEYEYCGSGADDGFSAEDLESAYRLPSATAGSGQTVAIVDAYDDPDAQADLSTYRSTYDLPACESGCFTKVNQNGGTTYPEANAEWSLEISLDVDMVSAACPKCHILLVEANNNSVENLGAAESEAATLGATQISNSYGSREVELGRAAVEENSGYYSHPGIAVAAAAGDNGYDNERSVSEECDNCSPNFPAGLATVIAVGGTSLAPQGEAGRGWNETVWEGTGSGCAWYSLKPAWQTDKGCTSRTADDVSAEASANTPVSVYDTYSAAPPGWQLLGGTSASTPLIAATIALEGSTLRAEGIEGIYAHPTNWFDVTTGKNWVSSQGECKERYLCNGETGYDGPTGVGTPDGLAAATEPSAVTEPASAVTGTSATLNAVVNPEASATTYHFEYGPTTGYGTEVPLGGVKLSSYTNPLPVNQVLSGLSVGTAYHFRVVATSAGGTTYGADRVFATPPKLPLSTFGSKGTSEGKLEGPEGVAINESGDIWVTDSANNRVEEFSPTGAFLKACGSAGSEKGEFKEPTGIAINPFDGALYVSDSGNGRVEVLSQSCAFTEVIGKSGSEAGDLSDPGGLAFDIAGAARGILLVADSGNNRIDEFEWTGHPGQFVASYGTKGSTEGQFLDPTGVVLAGKTSAAVDDFYVVDSGNDRIQEFAAAGLETGGTPSFKFLEQLGSKGSGEGQLSDPTGLALDPTAGQLDVTDTGNRRVEQFLPSGAYASTFGAKGTGGEDFESPRGIAVAARSGEVYVADYTNDRIALWQSARSQEPYVETEMATGIAEAGATLTGVVNPEGLETKTYFEYGTTAGYGSKTSELTVGAGKADVEETKAITGLTSSTTYHFRIVASNSKGTVRGPDQAFSTAGKPSVETDAATGVADTSAELNAVVNPRGTETKDYFEYGPTTSYGSKTAEVSAGLGTSDLALKATVTGLAAGSSYHFRVVAVNTHGTADGADQAVGTKDKPVAETNGVTALGETEATMNGTVDPMGAETKYYFEYGLTTAYGSKTSEASAGAGTSNKVESSGVTGLAASTVYHFRFVAVSAHGRSEGSDQRFSTTGKPTVKTSAATSAGESEATLNGTVNPHGAETNYYFEYGPTVAYGARTAEASAGAGTKSVAESKVVTGLAASTTYHFRIVATNSKGTADGADEVLSTKGKPSVETNAATNVGETEATLNGSVNPRGAATKFYFEYGPTVAYGSRTSEASGGAGTSNVEESKAIAGLGGSSTYHFRIVATNSHGTSDGADEQLTTGSKPAAETEPPTGASESGATLEGLVDPNGSATKYYFEFGPTQAYGSKTAEASAGSGSTNVEEGTAITGLTANTLYHFRIVAANKYGATDGSDMAFGAGWAVTALTDPSEALNSYLTAVSCASPAACTAVGEWSPNGNITDKAFAETWNGREWGLQTMPDPSGAEKTAPDGISCSSATACTASGYYVNSAGAYLATAEDLAGGEWKSQTVSEPAGTLNGLLSGVSCTSSSACTAVGWYEASAGVELPWASRWNGTTWTVQSVSAPTGAKATYPYGVSCTSATACTMAGFYDNSSGAPAPFAEVWNGTEWTVQAMSSPSGATKAWLKDVSCSSSTACTAAGEYRTTVGSEMPFAERWNGSSWTVQTMPEVSGAEYSLLDGVSCGSSLACTAVGVYRHGTNKYAPVGEHWNGTEWHVESPPIGEKGGMLAGGVSCATATTCVAVGSTSGESLAEIEG
jgi:hypothetical protein